MSVYLLTYLMIMTFYSVYLSILYTLPICCELHLVSRFNKLDDDDEDDDDDDDDDDERRRKRRTMTTH